MLSLPVTPFSLRDHRLIPRLGYTTTREHIIGTLNAEYNRENGRHYFPSAKARQEAALILASLPTPTYLSLPLAHIDQRQLPDGAAAIYPRSGPSHGRNYGGFACRTPEIAADLLTQYIGKHKLSPSEQRRLLDDLEHTDLPLEDFADAALMETINRGRTLHFTAEDRTRIIARIDAARNALTTSNSHPIEESIQTGMRILGQRGQVDDTVVFTPRSHRGSATLFGILVAKTSTKLAILTDDSTGDGVILDRPGIRFPLRADGRSELTPNTLAPIAIKLDTPTVGFATQLRSHNDAPSRFDDRLSTLLLATAMVHEDLNAVVSVDINDAQHDIDGTICAITPYYAAVIDSGATIEPISTANLVECNIGDRYQMGPSFVTTASPTRTHRMPPPRAHR